MASARAVTASARALTASALATTSPWGAARIPSGTDGMDGMDGMEGGGWAALVGDVGGGDVRVAGRFGGDADELPSPSGPAPGGPKAARSGCPGGSWSDLPGTSSRAAGGAESTGESGPGCEASPGPPVAFDLVADGFFATGLRCATFLAFTPVVPVVREGAASVPPEVVLVS
jgi:hypothetical protein